MTLIGETNSSDNPTQEDLMQWASDYGLTHPVVADPGFSEYVNYLWADPGFTGNFGLPNMVLLSPGLQVEYSNSSFGTAEIEALLAQ
jgi:hypothetical protein